MLEKRTLILTEKKKNMNKRPILVAFSNQKGGVGKSTITVLLASYFNYVRGIDVAVVDCDYPQFSLEKLRNRDLKNLDLNRLSK